MKERYVYDLCDVTIPEDEEWINSFRCYPDLKNITKKIIRIAEYYNKEFIKFNTIEQKDGEIWSIEYEVIDDNDELKKYKALLTIIPEDREVAKRMKSHMYI